MDDEASTIALLERMLCDINIEPTDLPLAVLSKITNYFSEDMQIGHGGFAAVYKGRLGNGKTVAVKKLFKVDMDEKKYNEEVDCLMKVSHRNIVRFLGYCANTHVKRSECQGKFVMADVRHRLLCFEYLSKGSLRNYISDESFRPDWETRYTIIKGICEGLSYLHHKHIVHLDLKPENILLSDNMVPKISDFGLSRCFAEDQTRSTTSKLLGSMGYMAPEFYDGHITMKSDIYSLGIILTEILTGQKGYSTHENIVKCWRKRLEESPKKEKLLEQVSLCADISIYCTDNDPTERPDAWRITRILQKLERSQDNSTKDAQSTSLVAQPPRGNQPVPSSFDAIDAIIEYKSFFRPFALSSSAPANVTPVLSVVVMKIDTVLGDEAAKEVVEKLHGEAVEMQNRIRNIRERLTLFMAKEWKHTVLFKSNGDALCSEMLNVAWRVEDMMDKYLYYSLKMKDEGFLKKIITGWQYVTVFGEIADELVKVDMEIGHINERMEFVTLSPSHTSDYLMEMSQVSFPELVKHVDLVGTEDNRRILTEWLYSDELGSNVITVSGMGGSGKSVLVANVYKHEMINFPSHAWITVSQTYSVDALLRDLLSKVGYIEHLSDRIKQMDVYDLKVEIRRRIKHMKCLIVLDDVWSKDVYFQMCDGFQNIQQIRIIITTRKNHVAALAPPTRRLDLKPLSDTHAFNLFRGITFHDDECPKELEQHATPILARCQGLPQAIVSIGRLFSSARTCDFLSRMYYDLEVRSELPDNEIMRGILEPSYHDLSEDLKNCFLYCSMFPEDYQISCESLVRMWVAEGFVLSRGNNTPEEVAEENIKQLIDCNLLVMMQNDEQGRVVACKMHGIARGLARAVAKKVNSQFTNTYYSIAAVTREEVRRLSIMFRWSDERIRKFRFPRLRTLVSVGTVPSSAQTLSSFLSESIFLTILELQDSEITEVPESLGTLFNIRYIGLRRTKVTSLPDSLVRLSNLQTLDIKETKIQNLPRGIGNVKKLRHLFADRYADKKQDDFPSIFGVEPPKHVLNSSESPYIFGVQPPNDLSNLDYLETLETVQSTRDLPNQLKRLWRLRKVWIDNINTKDCENLFVTLSTLPQLSSLLLSARDENEQLLIKTLNPVKLRSLITIGQWAPGTLGSWELSLGKHLNNLDLSWCYLGKHPLNMLARELPCLTYLKLSNIYGAETLDFTKGSFPVLKMLVLKHMDDVDNMVLRYGALPSIEALYIVSLTKLDKVPHGLESLSTLQKLWLLNLHRNFKAEWHKNEMHKKMQHVLEIHI